MAMTEVVRPLSFALQMPFDKRFGSLSLQNEGRVIWPQYTIEIKRVSKPAIAAVNPHSQLVDIWHRVPILLRTIPKAQTMIENIQTIRNGSVLEITINRPQVRNALNARACRELSYVLDTYQSDDSLLVAILTGAGDRAFCAGHDLLDGFDDPMPPSGWAGLADRTDISKPLIAAVNGFAYGGGFEIALACDIVIAEEGATFSLSEPRVGFAALGGASNA